MPLVQSKQIRKFITGRVRVPNAVLVAAGLGSGLNVDAALTTALSTASDQGTSVPLQNHIANVQPGLIFTGSRNLVEVYDAATKEKLYDKDGREVYGRLVNAASVLLDLKVLVNNVETPFAVANNTTIDIVVPYVFDFYSLPTDFATSLKTAFVNDDPMGAARMFSERLNVTALNTLSALTNKYNGGYAEINVNGQVIATTVTPANFTIATNATTVVWSQANAGFALETSDVVTIRYTY